MMDLEWTSLIILWPGNFGLRFAGGGGGSDLDHRRQGVLTTGVVVPHLTVEPATLSCDKGSGLNDNYLSEADKGSQMEEYEERISRLMSLWVP